MALTVRERIDRLLAEKGWTQVRLAQEMGITRQAVNDFMRVERNRPITIHKIAKAFGVSVDYFFD